MPDARVAVLEEGQYISYASCGLPYFLSCDIEEYRKLFTTPYEVEKNPGFFTSAKGVQVLTGIRAHRIDPKQKKVHCQDAISGQKISFDYDKLVIATGAKPIIPSIRGIDLPGVCTFNRLEDAIELRQAASGNRLNKVAILGAGYVGCQLCESFKALWGIETDLFEQESQVLPQMLDAEMARVAEAELQRQEIGLHLNVEVSEISRDNDKLDVAVEEGTVYSGFDRIIVGAGVAPRTDLALDSGIGIGPTGGIVINERTETNVADIYAAGDCVETRCALTGKPLHLPLGSLANRMGRVAANVIAGKGDSFAPITGASCLKVFDLNVAAVGLTGKRAREAGYDVGESWGFFQDKADYYPESHNISVKMVFDKKTRRILGVQAAGKGEAIRRVDAASIMIRESMTLDRVCQFEPAYAPPYADALDPLHVPSYLGIASLEEGIQCASPLEAIQIAGGSLVLDVREPAEVESNPIPFPCSSVMTVPYTEIRSHIESIPRDKPILVVCARGSRSSETVRILKHHGCENVRYMGGGLGFMGV